MRPISFTIQLFIKEAMKEFSAASVYSVEVNYELTQWNLSQMTLL